MLASLLPEDSGKDHADDKSDSENDEKKIRFFHHKPLTQRTQRKFLEQESSELDCGKSQLEQRGCKMSLS